MLHPKPFRVVVLCAFLACLAAQVQAQASGPRKADASPAVSNESAASAASEMDEVRRKLREQREEIERMRATVNEQSRMIDELRQRVEQSAQSSAASANTASTTGGETPALTTADASTQGPQNKNQTGDTDSRLKTVEEQVKKNTETLTKQLGSITFSGDIRIRYESIYGQLNATANADNPAILGNDITSRQRFRLRARLNMRGQIGKEFDWGVRLATGSFADVISANQTLTDFYNRKPFALDNAYIAWMPQRAPGLRLQAGKVDVPWLRTEMTIDNDVSPEGFSETYSRGFKKSSLKNITFVAWQLPFLERNSAFVRNANGTVNVDESRRAGRDLALYGAQLRARFEPSKTIGLTLSAADLYFSGTQFISPIQVFGNQLQLPVTFTIPATATSPAQTFTSQVSIPRELLVAGNGNLGISIGSNNAINRDGRLASGYNLVDLLARLDLTKSKRYPVALIFNFVTNTQTHDLVTAGPGGLNLIQSNNENNGYWAEIQVGRQKERGDLLFGYTFVRIEKDAVLTPFNFSDFAQQSDMRGHRFTINYTADPRVILTLTGFITERPNGLSGVFGATPAGSLNRPTTRIQFDTTFRF
jgi:hypothetical protein